MHKKVKVSELYPNPYRRIDRGYPIDKEKVAALRESYRQTGFWGNVVARKNGKGYQIAYGHHRLKALQEEFGGDKVIDLIVRDINEPNMIKIMARENMAEWSSNAAVEHETIRAVVDAIGEDTDGEIAKEVFKLVPPVTPLRLQPGSVTKKAKKGSPSGGEPFYTKRSIAEFLGWTRTHRRGEKQADLEPNARFQQAWQALELIEGGMLAEKDFRGLQRDQAKCVIDNAIAAYTAKKKVEVEWNRAAKAAEHAAKKAKSEADREFAEKQKKEAEARAAKYKKEAAADAKKVAHATRDHFKKGYGTATAKAVVQTNTEAVAFKDIAMPPKIDEYADRVLEQLQAYLKEGDLFDRLKLLKKFASHVNRQRLIAVKNELLRVAERAEKISSDLSVDESAGSRRVAKRKAISR